MKYKGAMIVNVMFIMCKLALDKISGEYKREKVSTFYKGMKDNDDGETLILYEEEKLAFNPIQMIIKQ